MEQRLSNKVREISNKSNINENESSELKIVKHRYDIDITSNKIRESKIGYIT
jgi:hypothetical protein